MNLNYILTGSNIHKEQGIIYLCNIAIALIMLTLNLIEYI